MDNSKQTWITTRIRFLFEQLHQNMKARFHFNGSLSELIAIDNGVKQGDISAPTLFSTYFVVTDNAFRDRDAGVFIRFRTTGKVFSFALFYAISRNLQTLVREPLCTDDTDFIAHTEEDIHEIMKLLSDVCTAFGLKINLKKTKVILIPPPGHQYVYISQTQEKFQAPHQGDQVGDG